jgi:uncharacterized membrane protein YoaK (UPF0700 family)
MKQTRRDVESPNGRAFAMTGEAQTDDRTLGHVHDRRVRDALLVALTFSTGAVDAISWICLGKVFSAFMTGNLAFLGFRTAGIDGPSVVRAVASIVAFGVGAFVAARIVEPTRHLGLMWSRRVTAVLGGVGAAHVAFLALWVVVDGHPSSITGHVLIAMSAFAMGMQTFAIFSLGLRATFTTAATATWALFMGDLATSAPRSERQRLAAVLVALFAGAVAGSLLVAHARVLAPALPLAVCSLVVVAATASGRVAALGRQAGATISTDGPDGQAVSSVAGPRM